VWIGKEEDFQAWLALVDPDRFYGKARQKAQPKDITDIMRRMVKEDLVKFDGSRLFPERRAETIKYTLSPPPFSSGPMRQLRPSQSRAP
jgi:hypothetical protein